MSDPLLEIKNLVTGFETESGLLKAVDGVSFTVPKGTCVGIVGESGCGKSVTAMSIVRLLPQPMGKILDGQILFKGRDLVQAKETDMHGIRGRHIGVIFQEPMTALNPVHSIGRQIGESLMLHRGMNTREARDAAIQLLQRVRIPAPEQRVDEFPHQLSGGMRQRVVIAIALACHPELIIADEPTTALDVTVQAQILSLLKDLQAEMGSSSILITHDLGVIAQSCDSVVVMYAGRVVEKAPVRELFANPRHAYTKGLLASIPQLSSVRKTKLPTIPGQVASIADFVPGCRFCQRQGVPAEELTERPPLVEISPDHFVEACPRKYITGEASCTLLCQQSFEIVLFACAFVVCTEVENDFSSLEYQFGTGGNGSPYVFADFHSETTRGSVEDHVAAQRHHLSANQHIAVSVHIAGCEPTLFIEFLIVGQISFGDKP